MEMYEEFKDRRKDFEILAFHDTKATDFAQLDAKLEGLKSEVWGGRDLPFPILLDSTGETLRRYGVSSFPTVIVIDPKGKVVKHGGEYTVRTHLMETSEEVKKHLRALKAARTEEKFGPAVASIRKAGGGYAAYALSSFAGKGAKHPWQFDAIRAAIEELGGQWSLGFFLGDHGLKAKEAKTRAEAAAVLGRIGERNLLFTLSDAYNAETDAEVKKALSDAMTILNDKR